MQLSLALVVHTQSTLQITCSYPGKLISLHLKGNELIPAQPATALRVGPQTVPLTPGLYHLKCHGAGWATTGGCTVVAVPLGGEDPWPIPPGASSSVIPPRGSPAYQDFLKAARDYF